MSTDLLKVEEVAKRLRVKVSWVYTHADALGVYHLGKYLRFSWERVIERLERNPELLVSRPNEKRDQQDSKQNAYKTIA